MPREVEYRDFPGGPIRIEFSDELPHWNMCAPCGMLSAEMYKDERGHFFCRACVDANSQRKRIFCKHENSDVQLSDLNEATELVLSTQELTVFCPNKKLGCTKYCPLNNMKRHWVECPITPNTKCKACDTMLPTKDLRDHEGVCPETYIQCTICCQGMPRRTYENHQNECQRPPEPSKRGAIEKKSFPFVSSSASAPSSLTGPEVASMKGHDPSMTKSITDEEKKSCQFCERPVKKCNYEKHLQVCVKREEERSHRSLPVKEEWKAHEDGCQENPVNTKREPTPSVSRPGRKGRKNLTSDIGAKNSGTPKQLLHSDKDHSFEIIRDDEVEAVAETKTENKASDVILKEPKRGADCPRPLDPDHSENDGVLEVDTSDGNGDDRGNNLLDLFMVVVFSMVLMLRRMLGIWLRITFFPLKTLRYLLIKLLWLVTFGPAGVAAALFLLFFYS
ncbi:uncharacterized protein LOC120848893 isoform X2 [Ixodes scapularis]|uniref:uncharacterized protein LOC120848893 isoform X2 n=1 Tax=Ixodes scapularis TaxID=6945 RepID=UPI001C387D61|nr:uncharacterized protein LOC120848893 isoform X2 [Ixodes scapularis]